MNKAKMESQIWEHRDKNHNAEVNLEQLWKIQESLETKLEEQMQEYKQYKAMKESELHMKMGPEFNFKQTIEMQI